MLRRPLGESIAWISLEKKNILKIYHLADPQLSIECASHFIFQPSCYFTVIYNTLRKMETQ
jgi:hypothetical protein